MKHANMTDGDRPPIVQAGDPVLRSRAREVLPAELATRDFQLLVTAMVTAMREAPGVGLAAPQIGVPLRVIVLEDRHDLMERVAPEHLRERGRVPFPLQVIVNPVLVVTGTDRATFFEGCLSVRGYMALVERHFSVEVTGLDEHGDPMSWRAEGWPARILQHEVDHLDGTLYVDRMLTRSLCSNDEAQRWLDLPVGDVRKTLRT